MKMFDLKTSIHDAVSFAKNCQSYTGDADFKQLSNDALTMSAIQCNLILLSEALKRIELVLTEKTEEKNFKDFIVLGDDLLEKYDDVNYYEILSTVKNELPDLVINLEKLLSRKK